MPTFLSALLLVLAAAAGFHLVMPLLLTYDLEEDGLAIRFLGVPCRFIPYREIEKAWPARLQDYAFAMKWNSRILGGAIAIRLNRGFWRLLTITPLRPEAFLTQLQRHIHRLSTCDTSRIVLRGK